MCASDQFINYEKQFAKDMYKSLAWEVSSEAIFGTLVFFDANALGKRLKCLRYAAYHCLSALFAFSGWLPLISVDLNET